MKAKNNEISIVTGIIQTNEWFDNKSRLSFLSKIIQEIDKKAEVLLLPAGFLVYEKFSINALKVIEKKISEMIHKYDMDLIICFGIDSGKGSDQLGVAISPKGIVAIGRKFYPASGEDDINKAKSPHEKEFGFNRTFSIKDMTFYLAVCYDSFGIKHLQPEKKGTTVILNLIHKFNPKGEGGSGDVDFARKGLACASRQWECPIYASTTFVHRPVKQIKWPSGVLWTKGKMSPQVWKYDDNPIKPIKEEYIETKNESIALREFILSA
jgi:hypothetical protein